MKRTLLTLLAALVLLPALAASRLRIDYDFKVGRI